jgi:hypothetical protein
VYQLKKGPWEVHDHISACLYVHEHGFTMNKVIFFAVNGAGKIWKSECMTCYSDKSDVHRLAVIAVL